MRIVFMGTPDFSGEALKSLLNSEHEVVAVFTQPDKPKGRGKKLSNPPVKTIALEAGIPIYQPTKIRDSESLKVLKDLNPDIIVVAAYGKILPKEMLELPPYGCINIHASILPKYRGAAPIHWAVINGEKETGITIMQMDEGMDTGDILLIGKIDIPEDAHTGEMFERLATLGGKLLIEALDQIKEDNIVPIKQNNNEATYAPMLTKDDELIQWNMSARNLHNKIRGMNPWPGVYTFFRDERLKIHKSSLIEENCLTKGKPGEIIDFSSAGILVATENGLLALEKVQPAGKKQLDFKDFVNGYKVNKGEVLGKNNG